MPLVIPLDHLNTFQVLNGSRPEKTFPKLKMKL